MPWLDAPRGGGGVAEGAALAGLAHGGGVVKHPVVDTGGVVNARVEVRRHLLKGRTGRQQQLAGFFGFEAAVMAWTLQPQAAHRDWRPGRVARGMLFWLQAAQPCRLAAQPGGPWLTASHFFLLVHCRQVKRNQGEGAVGGCRSGWKPAYLTKTTM